MEMGSILVQILYCDGAIKPSKAESGRYQKSKAADVCPKAAGDWPKAGALIGRKRPKNDIGHFRP